VIGVPVFAVVSASGVRSSAVVNKITFPVVCCFVMFDKSVVVDIFVGVSEE